MENPNQRMILCYPYGLDPQMRVKHRNVGKALP